ncbi:hypothetical protein A5662_16270 [Mycobacteriaceae bacterium 1482268.1]|nr:hypothetical protein A5662_16270 [Mycobacteriaceae bacterium 1482268.1]
MMFPARCAALTLLVAAAISTPSGVAQAEPVDPPPGPPLRHVQYTVWSEKPYKADIYYRDTDPPNWGEYSHNPYLYSPNIEADVGPDRKWILDAYLANPDAWAMVVAGLQPDSQATPNLHCVLAVDGVVAKTAQGPKGALCSVRPW